MTTQDKTPITRPFNAGIYFQTTEFTCGPAALLMAMAALNPVYRPSRLEELKIWREANLIYMGDGHAGCGQHGLAVAAIKRGYAAEIFEHNANEVFAPWTNSPEEAAVQQMLAAHDRKRARRRGCAMSERAITRELVRSLLAEDKQLITLTTKDYSGYWHWVLLHDLVGDTAYIVDPHERADRNEQSPFAREDNRPFMLTAPFDDFIAYGPSDSTVLIALTKKTDTDDNG